MKNVSILDCTLRDGGCVNDFNFGAEKMRIFLKALEFSNVEYIELGYLDSKNGSMSARTQYQSMEAVEKLISKDDKKPGLNYAVMIDFGKYQASLLPEASETAVDTIRFCYHKNKYNEAVEECKTIIQKGYKLIIQPMVNTRYTDSEFEAMLIDISEKLPETYGVYIVDSFGCMSSEQVKNRVLIADKALPQSIAVGFHGHNNQNLCLSHAKNLAGLCLEREIIVDGTLYGMGKGAGNLRVETFAKYINESDYRYNLGPMVKVIKDYIIPLDEIYKWGHCKEYSLSAKYSLTPSYAKLFYRQEGLSFDETDTLLSRIEDSKKDSFNKQYAMELLNNSGFSMKEAEYEKPDLLDTRGYKVKLTASNKAEVKVKYIGPKEIFHKGYIYDNDPYVVSRVENASFKEEYTVIVKDKGIRKSGFLFELSSDKDCRVTVNLCDDKEYTFELKKAESFSKVISVDDLCKEERDYLDKIHRILYLVLGEVDRVCVKYDIPYYLICGGLIGAVRQGDIISWDDDVDIAMKRKDFEKFRKVAPKELGEDFMYLDCSKLGGFLDFMCRVVYLKEDVPENVFKKVHGLCDEKLENKLPLDIFILDKAADSPKKHAKHMTRIRGIYGLGMAHRAYIDKSEYKNRDLKTRLAVKLLSTCGKLIPLASIYKIHDRISTKYEKKNTNDYFMSNSFLPYIHTRYNQSWFEGSNRIKLGNMEVSAPADINGYLYRAYFDYYHYPRYEKRVPEHSPKASGIH